MVNSLYSPTRFAPTRFFSCPTDTGVGSTETLFIWGTSPRVFQPLCRKSATTVSQPGFHATQNLDLKNEGKGVFVGQRLELRAAASGPCQPLPPRARVSIGLSSPFPPSILCAQVLVTTPFLSAQITKLVYADTITFLCGYFLMCCQGPLLEKSLDWSGLDVTIIFFKVNKMSFGVSFCRLWFLQMIGWL